MKFYRKVDGEEISSHRVTLHLNLPFQEDELIRLQAKEECTSISSILRKSFRKYLESVGKGGLV